MDSITATMYDGDKRTWEEILALARWHYETYYEDEEQEETFTE